MTGLAHRNYFRRTLYCTGIGITHESGTVDDLRIYRHEQTDILGFSAHIRRFFLISQIRILVIYDVNCGRISVLELVALIRRSDAGDRQGPLAIHRPGLADSQSTCSIVFNRRYCHFNVLRIGINDE